MPFDVKTNNSAPSSATSPDGSAAFPVNMAQVTPPIPTGSTAINGSSGVVSAASAVATLTSAAARTAYITGFSVAGLGATTAIVATITITGLLGGTINFGYPVPAGVGVAGQPMNVVFPTPIPASAVNTNIVVTVASFGAGNTGAAVMAQGFLV